MLSYPSEAILALTRLYQLDGNTRWIDSAEAAALYLITVRDNNRPTAELPHDHWLLYGLNELHRLRPNPLYISHSRRIVDAILASQHRDNVARD